MSARVEKINVRLEKTRDTFCYRLVCSCQYCCTADTAGATMCVLLLARFAVLPSSKNGVSMSSMSVIILEGASNKMQMFIFFTSGT